MSWIKQIVQDLTTHYSTTDPFELADYKHINVIPWNLHEDIKGFYKYDKRNKYIFINNNLDRSSQRYVCAHELGHSQLHPRVNTPFLRTNTLFSLSKIEVEADTFAAELLIPDMTIIRNNRLTINDISSIYEVPEEVVHFKKF